MGVLAVIAANAQPPSDAAKLREAGFGHIQKGEWAAANSVFDSLLARHPDDGRGRYGKAVALFNLRQIGEADALLLALIASEGSAQPAGLLADALVLSAVIESVKGHNDAAVAKLERAVSLVPGNFDAHFSLGRARFASGDLERSVAAFRSALAIRPEHQKARFFYATALEQNGETAAAAREYREMLRREPRSVDGRLGLGILLIKTEANGSSEGVRLLREAVSMDATSYEGNVTLGKALLKGGDAASAVGYLEQAAKIDERNPEPQFQLSIAYRKLGRRAEADAASAKVKAIHEARRGVANDKP